MASWNPASSSRTWSSITSSSRGATACRSCRPRRSAWRRSSRRWAAIAQRLEARIPPRWGSLTSELLAVNMVMAGCKPEYAPVVRAAVLALCDPRFNLNGIQATTHVVAPLLVVNGPIAREIGMNPGGNVFGSGNRANATIGRALRLILLSVGGGHPGGIRQEHPGASRQVHVLHRRERGEQPVGAVPRRARLRSPTTAPSS